ncbi:hypothetical protein KJ865_16890, partial [Myxococcota bacterium]|nr:hypothetical protein [Myxococcota bacterium]
LPVSIPAPLKPETYGQKSQTPAQSVPGYASAAVAPASQPYQQPYQQPYAQPQGRPGGLSGLSEYELKKRQELEEYERQQKARLYGTTQPQSPQGAPFPSAQYPAVNAHSGHFTAAAPAIDPGELENAKAALTRIQAFEDQFIDSMNDAIRNDYFYLVEEIKTIDAKPQAEQYELMRRYRGFLKEKLYWLKWSTYNDYILLHKFRVAHS